jgi:hypothetical protein
VLITSRERGWDEIAAPIGVDVLTRAESVEMLQGRVPGLTETDADRSLPNSAICRWPLPRRPGS